MIVLALAVTASLTGVWQLCHRTSPLVRRWKPSTLRRHTVGALSVLDSGPSGCTPERVVLLLHGLGATGDYFGAFYDDLGARRRVLIVDLLGFGGSLDEALSDFGVDDHVDALDRVLEALDLSNSRFVVAAHSMSSAVALTFAERDRERIEGVFLWGPPIYLSGAATRSVAKQYGIMGRLFAVDTTWAHRACQVSCLNRDISGRLMALGAPRWPTAVSSQASQHTWEAYHLSLRHLILDYDWSAVLPANIPLTIFHGVEDPIGDQQHIVRVAGNASIVNVPGANHHVALQHPELLLAALED